MADLEVMMGERRALVPATVEGIKGDIITAVAPVVPDFPSCGRPDTVWRCEIRKAPQNNGGVI